MKNFLKFRYLGQTKRQRDDSAALLNHIKKVVSTNYIGIYEKDRISFEINIHLTIKILLNENSSQLMFIKDTTIVTLKRLWNLRLLLSNLAKLR